MNQNLKKFIIAFLSTSAFSILTYFLVNLYDQLGHTISILTQNLYYIIFLFISIVFSLTLYGNENKKSKLIMSLIFFINFLYLVFLFGLSNIGLNQTQGLLLIGFLILGLISNYINNIFGHIITTSSVFGIIMTIFFTIIPFYENAPDVEGFEKSLSIQIMTYSKIEINQSMTLLEKDGKKYNFKNGLFAYDLNINNSGSQILFKSDKLYQNTFVYILTPNKEIVQIYPQSAINIDQNINIEIITGTVKYYPQNPKDILFTGNFIPSVMINQEEINTILGWYQKGLKEYISKQIGGKINQNKNITKISKILLEFLSKIMPNQFKDNLENFQNFNKYLNTEIKNSDYKNEFDNKKIQKDIIKDIKNSLISNKIIK